MATVIWPYDVTQCDFDAGQIKVRPNFQINIFTQKAHVSCSEISQDSQYVISFLVRCGELRKIASQKMASSIFRYILQIPFSYGTMVLFVVIVF